MTDTAQLPAITFRSPAAADVAGLEAIHSAILVVDESEELSLRGVGAHLESFLAETLSKVLGSLIAARRVNMRLGTHPHEGVAAAIAYLVDRGELVAR